MADRRRHRRQPAWNHISDVLGPASNVGQQSITALAIAPSHPQSVYAATADGRVFATTNGGSSWPARDAGLSGMGGGRIADIRIDPTNPSRAFAVGLALGSVWYFDPGTLNWRNIAGDLPPYLKTTAILPDWRAPSSPIPLGPPGPHTSARATRWRA